MILALAILSGWVAIARPFLPSQKISWLGAYKDLAHALTGFLLAGIVFDGRTPFHVMFWGLTTVEVVVFFVGFPKRTR